MKQALIGLALLLLQPAKAQKNGDKSVYYEEVNWRRSKYAKENRIANMNFLDYDFGMEKFIIEELEKHDNCPNRTILIQRNNLKIFLNAHRDNEIEKETFVAGITKTARWTTKSEQCDNMKYGFHLALDLPKNPVIHGAPGSQCPEDREADKHGLCVSLGSQDIPWPFPTRRLHAKKRKLFLEDATEFFKNHPEIINDVAKAGREFLKGELEKKKKRLREIVARVKEGTRLAEKLRQEIAYTEKLLRSKRGFVEQKPSTDNHARRLYTKNRKPFSLGDIDPEKLRPHIDAMTALATEIVENGKNSAREKLESKKKELEEILVVMKKGAEYVEELRKEIAGLEKFLRSKRGSVEKN